MDTELQEFIRTSIDSVETLAILLLLRRSPGTFWGAAAIAGQLALPPDFVARKLASLRTNNVIRMGADSGAYRYAPADERLASCIDRLAAAFREGRVTIENEIRATRQGDSSSGRIASRE